MSSLPHRKQAKTYNEPGHAHELTFSCFQRQPFLTKDRTRRWFVDALERAREKCELDLWAYVIMPEHVHVLFQPRKPRYEISVIRSAIKLGVSVKAVRYLRRHAPDALPRLADIQPNGETHYRFWQRGGGYDRNVIEPSTLQAMIDYIHNNPVRRGLAATPTNWIWSSARYWSEDKNVPIRMDPLPWLNG
jgi:putative transposase